MLRRRPRRDPFPRSYFDVRLMYLFFPPSRCGGACWTAPLWSLWANRPAICEEETEWGLEWTSAAARCDPLAVRVPPRPQDKRRVPPPSLETFYSARAFSAIFGARSCLFARARARAWLHVRPDPLPPPQPALCFLLVFSFK